MNIRPTKLTDAAQIAEIYNYYIETSVATFETETIDSAEMEKRIADALAGNYPFYIAEEKGEIIGYAYGHPFRARDAYRYTIEVSVYIKEGFEGKRTGTLLYEWLFGKISEGDFHSIVAGISLPNEASVKLHEKFGMAPVAHFKEVGFKFGRWIDTGYWQKVLNK